MIQKFKVISIGFLLFACMFSAQAAEVSISKLRVNIEAKQTADFITLQNKSKDKQSYEISIEEWDQEDKSEIINGEQSFIPANVMKETKDIVISPKTVVIPPKSERLVRIIVKNRQKADEAYSYRMTINQLPSKELGDEVNVVRLLFKVSLPIFVYPSAVKKVDTMAYKQSIEKQGADTYVYMKNEDDQHIQLLNMYVKDSTQPKKAVNTYLLPGASTKMKMTPEMMAAPEIMFDTDKGQFTYKNPLVN